MEKTISRQIKPIDEKAILVDFNKLKGIANTADSISSRCRIGNNTVDYFTYTERLNTRGKYNINYYEFVERIEEFKKKPFISNMLKYYEDVKNKNKNKNNYVVLKEVYNICISAINIFRPIVAIEIYNKYKPRCVLDFACGWGGRLIGACAINVQKYIGIEINKNLEIPYVEMKEFLKLHSTTQVEIQIKNALDVDYSKIEYDMVLTSPPYYFLEKYSHNEIYNSKLAMKNDFYIPLFANTFKYLQKGGQYCLNINKEMYETICLELFGEANDVIELKKSKRQNDYTEYIYVWYKE